MNYREARQFIDRITMEKGSVPGLDAIRTLLFKMGNPQDKLKIIHVAGTNGKGSVTAYLLSILNKAGYKVGTYNSPSVFEYLERIRTDGVNIGEEEYAEGITKIKEIYDSMSEDKEPLPTAFEMETALAFDYFVRKNCDIVIAEAGMGGRMDATNVCESVLVSAIMSVSMDHMAFLGNTIESIASEKAGIIKQNCPVVIYNQDKEVLDIIRRKADEMKAEVVVTSIPEITDYDNERTTFSYSSMVSGKKYDNLIITLKGMIQVNNACVAVEIIEMLNRMQYNINDLNIRNGFADTKWPGRFQKICDRPLIYIDGAHNPDAVKRLSDTIDMYFRGYKKIYVMGVFKDKDFERELEYIIEGAEHIYTVTPDNARALDASALAETINKRRDIATACDSVNMAMKCAADDTAKDKNKSVIIAFGSLSYLGDVVGCIKKRLL